jgi:hypothetical protein
MAFDFTQLIGGGGELGPLMTGLNLAFDVALCVGTLNIFACFGAVVNLFELAFELFFPGVFSGRPAVGKDSATDDIALFLIASANPITALWGMGIRALEGQGIPLSTGNPSARAKITALNKAFIADITKQFGAIQGPKYAQQYGYLCSLNHPDSNGQALRARQAVDESYKQAVLQGIIDPSTGFPFPGKVVPPPPTPPKPPPPPPPVTCTDPCELASQYIMRDLMVPQVAGIGDALTQGIAPVLSSLADALWFLRTSLGPGDTAGSPSIIEAILAALVDLQDCICSDLNAMAGPQFTANNANLTAIATALKSIAASLDNEALVKAVAKQMIIDGFIPSDLGQLLTA